MILVLFIDFKMHNDINVIYEDIVYANKIVYNKLYCSHYQKMRKWIKIKCINIKINNKNKKLYTSVGLYI